MAVFNVVMIVAFVFSNVYMWDFFNTKINMQGYRDENGATVIPFIWINGLEISVGHDAWTADGVVVPTALPTTIPNYPFIVFWIAILGDLAFFAIFFGKSDDEKR